MYSLHVMNPAGDKLRLTHNEKYIVTSVTGLTPVVATINTSAVGIADGMVYNSARLNARNIVITLRIVRDIENARNALYEYFSTKAFCTLFYRNGVRNVMIDGYVETFECDLFVRGETAQISIICPNPYFKNVAETVSKGETITNNFEFPTEFNNVVFSTLNTDTTTKVYNGGNVSTGINITIDVIGDVENPVIYNASTGEKFQLNRSFNSGDKIKINTKYGEKSVFLTRYGVEFNLINNFVAGSSWLQLKKGENTFTFAADTGVNNMRITFSHHDLFVGV